MNVALTLFAGAALGLAAGSLLVPLTRRELAASVARSTPTDAAVATTELPAPRIAGTHRVALAAVSGLLLAYVLYRVGWSFNALPPLLLLVGLVQLAYCDLTQPPAAQDPGLRADRGRRRPAAWSWRVGTGEWERLVLATLGGLVSFALFFVVNLMNPRWMAFGDVRLSLVFGFGLAWVSPIDLFEAFLYANLLALFTGLVLIVAHRADRRSALPFGLFMALGAALVLVT